MKSLYVFGTFIFRNIFRQLSIAEATDAESLDLGWLQFVTKIPKCYFTNLTFFHKCLCIMEMIPDSWELVVRTFRLGAEVSLFLTCPQPRLWVSLELWLKSYFPIHLRTWRSPTRLSRPLAGVKKLPEATFYVRSCQHQEEACLLDTCWVGKTCWTY